MKRFVFPGLAACLVAAPAFAVSPKVDAAIKTFKAIGADPKKLEIYCGLLRAMDAEDNKRVVDRLADQLGQEFNNASHFGDTLDEDSPDGKAYDSAVDELARKCS
jgi:hypothetical protein